MRFKTALLKDAIVFPTDTTDIPVLQKFKKKV